MLTNFKKQINKKYSFLKESKLLIAVSGGIDSVVLTHLLHQLNFDISIAHCNFNLRGIDSDKDEKSVKNLAKQLKTSFYVKGFDTNNYAKQNKLSIQEAARNLRYEWFNELIKKHQLDYIITAHNLNDSLETFLINLTRSTGLKGLTGIPFKNKKIIRPLLEFSREEITNFALENDIEWREDKSNAVVKYTRNKIRHHVIPVLQEINPNLLESFKQTLKNLQGSETIINDRINELKTNVILTEPKSATRNLLNYKQLKFSTKKLQKLNNQKAYLYELFAPYNFTNIDDIVDLLSAQSGKQLFSKTHRLIKDRDLLLLILNKKQEIRDKRQETIIINENDTMFAVNEQIFNIKTQPRNFGTKLEIQNPKTAQFDKSLLKFPLMVRKWEKGDYFYPLGMTGKKKLSKYFKDEKLSLIEKENIWLLLSDNQIIWIIGKRQDEQFKITNATKHILEITPLNII